MRFSVSSSELLSKISIGIGAISSNAVLPILEDFLFSIKDNILTIASSNKETTVITSIDVTADDDLEIGIPGKILIETIRALPEQPLDFEVDIESKVVHLKSSVGEYHLAGDSVEDFPELPAADDAESVTLASNTLLKAINNTAFATSTDEIRVAMTGVFMKVDFNELVFVATDAHKLVKYSVAHSGNDTTGSFIIPKKGLVLLRSALPVGKEVKVSFDSNNVFFDFDNTQIIIRLIDAKFPDYNVVIPVDNPNILRISRKDLLNSLRRLNIYANKSTNQVVLKIENDNVVMKAQDLDFSNEAEEVLACQYSGEPMTVGYNSKFFAEMLNVLDSDEIRLEMSTPRRAGLLYPDEELIDEELMMLVMPVMMTN